MVAGTTVLLQMETGVDEVVAGEIVSVNVLETPDALAVKTAVWVELVLEVDAEKLAVDVPAATFSDAGTVTTRLLEVRETLMAAVVAAESVTVQAEVRPAVSEPGSQARDETVGAPLAAGGESVSGNVTCAPPTDAVITPVCLLVTANMDAVNAALVFPLLTVTLPGTARFALLLPSATTKVEVGALPLTLTEQDAVPGAITVDGLQVRPESVVVADCVTEMVPPVPDSTIADPSEAAADIPVNWRPIDEGCVPVATVALTVATAPDVIVVAFCPDSTQVTVPAPGLQSIVLDAAFAAAPGAIMTLLIEDG